MSSPSSLIIVDCRFDYEFSGGHIRGAVNVSSKEQLSDTFFKSKTDIEKLMGHKPVIVFHCEYSQRRGPMLYSVLRGIDRELNTHCYPKLCYPEIYILEDGYKEFYRQFPSQCIGGYTPKDVSVEEPR